MKFSYNFIKEILPINLDPRELAQKLTMAGMEVEGLEVVGSDYIFDIEITTNRYDWLSVLGVAREMGAATGIKLNTAYPQIVKTPQFSERKVIIENNTDCPYYILRSIKNITVAPSDKTLQERVINSGINSISNIVDITNYCMMKWGNPLHAFDADKVMGDICVRRAKKGEKFYGLDDKEYELTPENLVIADNVKVIALAGVMGAKNSEVTNSTRNILLEAAVFSPLAVRKSRRAVGLDTDSSYRFERRVNADCLEFASQDAAMRIAATNNASAQAYSEAGQKPERILSKITIVLNKLYSYVGQVIDKNEVKTILEHLDCFVEDAGNNTFVITPSIFRFDLERDVDIYEEILRMYGFDKIQPALPFTTRQYDQSLTKELSGIIRRQNDDFNLRKKIETTISLCGFKQIITYSLESSEELEKFGFTRLVKLANPLRSQENVLRPALLCGMLGAIKNNLSHGQQELAFFELANIYELVDGKVKEQGCLALGVCAECDKNPFYLKGAIKTLLEKLAIYDIRFVPAEEKNCRNALAVYAKDRRLGFLGKLDKTAAALAQVKEDIFYAQLNLADLQAAIGHKRYQPFSYFPAVSRDISIVIGSEQVFSVVETLVKTQAGKLLNSLEVVDRYKGKDLPSGSSAITLRVWYQDCERTLTAAEVDAVHTKLREELIKLPQISLR